jgi:OTU-like cysteine protease
MLQELHLTEAELLIINKNEKKTKINIFQNEQKFKILLNEYLKTQKNKQCEAANVPNDGSCLYHAILHSFAATYSQQLEINHQKMRENVAIHMLRSQENTEYLRNFAMNENDNSGISMCISSSSKKALQERYVKYAKNHMYNTLDWPIELCLHIVAELYNLDLTVLQEAMDPREGQPSGYICERLRTVGLLLMTSSSTPVTASTAATTSSSTFTFSTTSTEPLLTSAQLPPQCSTRETKAIIIGNRWDQHYYSIGILIIICYNKINYSKIYNYNTFS